MFVKSRTFLAFVFRQDRKLLEARKAIEEALTVEPENQNLILYLVLVLRDLDESQEAESVLRRALEAAPGNEKLLFNLALVLHDLGRERETLLLMESVIEKNPTNTDALNYVAYALAEEGKDLGRAEKLSLQALQLSPNDGYYLDTLGWIQFKKGRIKEAEETITRSLSVTGDDIVIVEHLVEVLIASNNLERAVSLLKSAVEQKFSDDPADKEKLESQRRLRQRLDELVVKHPELASVKRSEPMIQNSESASQEVGKTRGRDSLLVP
jgi:Flp pilus assembly protein TadD